MPKTFERSSNMPEEYLTTANGQAELIVKKSRFMGSIEHVTSEEYARDFIERISAQYRDATHNVYCYALRQGGVMRFSDAGEPSGTAGRPALEALQSVGISDFCLVITRYFGGIKLGAGGLARAYRACAKHTLDTAGTVRMVYCARVVITSDYSDWPRLSTLPMSFDAEPGNIRYAEKVHAEFFIAPSELDELARAVCDISSGQARLEIAEHLYKGEPH